jgi:hypothetical protein
MTMSVESTEGYLVKPFSADELIGFIRQVHKPETAARAELAVTDCGYPGLRQRRSRLVAGPHADLKSRSAREPQGDVCRCPLHANRGGEEEVRQHINRF